MLAAGENTAFQLVSLCHLVVQSQGAGSFRQRVVELIQIQQGGAQEDVNICALGIDCKIFPVQPDSIGGTKLPVAGVGFFEEAAARVAGD